MKFDLLIKGELRALNAEAADRKLDLLRRTLGEIGGEYCELRITGTTSPVNGTTPSQGALTGDSTSTKGEQ